MICSKCGEVNSDTFRFCGMCGNVLDVRPETRRPVGAPVPGLPKIADGAAPTASSSAGSTTYTANKQAPSIPSTPIPLISGPSMLGLDQAGANDRVPNQPSMDSLREKAFSGLDSFFEPERPKTGGRRLLLLLVLLAALGAAGWWTYTNYLGVTGSRKENTASTSAEAPDDESSKSAAKSTPPAADAVVPKATAPAPTVPEGPSENASPSPEPAQKSADAIKPATPKIALGDKNATKHNSSVTTVTASKPTAPAAADTGDADFRKGEAYLYGRGMPENCTEAVKSLKAASAKSNAKARSAFGTMYATGHCVPRDLPTSYLWFAMALRVDPNNQILEKDLSAVWNQMTPPERQMATRMKQ